MKEFMMEGSASILAISGYAVGAEVNGVDYEQSHLCQSSYVMIVALELSADNQPFEFAQRDHFNRIDGQLSGKQTGDYANLRLAWTPVRDLIAVAGMIGDDLDAVFLAQPDQQEVFSWGGPVLVNSQQAIDGTLEGRRDFVERHALSYLELAATRSGFKRQLYECIAPGLPPSLLEIGSQPHQV